MKLIADKIPVFALGFIAGLLLVSGCATRSDVVFASDPLEPVVAAPTVAPPGPTAVPPRIPSAGGVVFQVGDLITVTYSDTTAEIAPHEERIKEDGNITLPLIGAVKAVGKTPGELQKEIRDLYSKYYLRLTVTVKYQAQELAYSVLGEVRAPGPKPYLGVTTVTKAIGAAGGLTEFASKRKIYLTRANGTKEKINYNKAIANSKDDPKVFPGDSINVEKSIW